MINQKVIDVDSQEIFAKKGITVFERLGLQGIQKVAQMAQVRIILQNLGQNFDPNDAVGVLDEVKHVVIGNSSYVQCNEKQSGCFTLTVQHWSEDICDEIEVNR